MNLELGDSSRSSSTAKRRISSHDDVQNEIISSPSCWMTTEELDSWPPAIFFHSVIPDWIYALVFLSIASFCSKYDKFEEHMKSSQAKLQAAEEESRNYKLKVEQQNSKLQIQFRSLFQEISHLKAELDVFSSHFNSLDSSPGTRRCR